VCKRIAWILVFSTLTVIHLYRTESVFAQETTRKLKSGSPPQYPEIARKLNIKGTARVLVTIAKDGKVTGVREVGGNPVLLEALVEAVKKWKYEPGSGDTTSEVKFDFQ